jgi:hypothetical protein
LTPDDEGTLLLPEVRKHSLNNTPSHPRRPKSFIYTAISSNLAKKRKGKKNHGSSSTSSEVSRN